VFAAAHVGVLPFGVLSVNDEIDVAALVVPERTSDALEQIRGTFTDVLVEPLCDREAEAPERDVIGPGAQVAAQGLQERFKELRTLLS